MSLLRRAWHSDCARLAAGLCLGLWVLASGPALKARADAPAGPRTVPDCVGLRLEEAKALVAPSGFELALTYGAEGPPGKVVDQRPGGLSEREAGTTLTLTVAGTDTGEATGPSPAPSAPRPVEPPSAPPTGPDAPPPTGSLPSLPPVETPPGPPSLPPPGPAPGPTAPAPAPSGIDLDALPLEALPNLNGPPLPNVLGRSAAEAERLLRGWRVVTELTLTPPESAGKIVEQDPEPTRTLAPGEAVTVVVGTATSPGPQARQVPALVGRTLDEALADLKAAGFVPTLRAAVSGEGERGRVLAQAPHRYSFAQRGGNVKVVVSRGPAGAAGPSPAPAVPPGPPAGETPPTGPLEPPPAPPAPQPGLPEPTPPVPPTEPPPPPTEPLPAPVPPVPPVPPTPPAPPAPGPVLLLGPLDSESAPRAYGATFEWRTVPNADGYEWSLEQEAGGTWREVRSEKLVGTKFRPARIEAGRYRWRVRALRGPTPGAWTDYRLLFRY